MCPTSTETCRGLGSKKHRGFIREFWWGKNVYCYFYIYGHKPIIFEISLHRKNNIPGKKLVYILRIYFELLYTFYILCFHFFFLEFRKSNILEDTAWRLERLLNVKTTLDTDRHRHRHRHTDTRHTHLPVYRDDNTGWYRSRLIEDGKRLSDSCSSRDDVIHHEHALALYSSVYIHTTVV